MLLTGWVRLFSHLLWILTRLNLAVHIAASSVADQEAINDETIYPRASYWLALIDHRSAAANCRYITLRLLSVPWRQPQIIGSVAPGATRPSAFVARSSQGKSLMVPARSGGRNQ